MIRYLKFSVAGAVAALAFGGAGVVLAANVTPTPASNTHKPAVTASPKTDTTDSGTSNGNSTDTFGSKVQAQIKVCKAERPTSGGKQGIGQCLSKWVVANNPGHLNHAAGTNTSGH